MRQRVFGVSLVLLVASVAPAGAGVIFFNNEAAAFAAAMAGNVSLGVEDFEESTQGFHEVRALDVPLVQGVANEVYPAGLTLPLAVQANTLGGAAVTPSPAQAFGLAALSADFLDVVSDVVLANFGNDSLDVIFQTGPAGVGFNPIFTSNGAAKAAALTIQVFDELNNLLGSTTIDAEPTGANFLGIQATSASRIGRINIFSADGSEGADNVEIFASVPEPSSLSLLAVGLVSARLARRKRAGGKVGT